MDAETDTTTIDFAETAAILGEAGAVEIDVRCMAPGSWLVGASFPFDDGADGYPHGKPYWGNTARPKVDGTPHWESPQDMARHHVENYQADLARFAKVAESETDEGAAGHRSGDASVSDASAVPAEPVASAPVASGADDAGDANQRDSANVGVALADEPEPVAANDTEGTGASGDDLSGDLRGAVIDETPLPESQPADEPAEALADFVDSGTDAVAEGDESGAEAGPAGGGLQVLHGDGQDGAGDSDLPYAFDADFEEVGDDVFGGIEGSDDLAALAHYPDLGAEIVADDQEPLPPQDRFIGLDDLDRRRSLRIGDVIRYALDHTPRITEDQFDRIKALRNYVAGVGEGSVTRDSNDATLRSELDALETIMRVEHNWNAERDRKVTYLNSASREEVEAYDPECDWPQ